MYEKHEALGQKQKMEIEDSDRKHVDGLIDHLDKKVVCPVCGKILQSQLPSKTSIFEENIPFDESIRIIDSELILECIFDHCTDEEDDDLWLENPHAVKAVIKAVINGEGECTQFEITEIHPG